MVKYLLVLLMVSICNAEVFEYTYRASQDEGEVEARNKCIILLQKEALLQTGVFVKASTNWTVEEKNGKMSDEIIVKHRAELNATVKVKEISHYWNGLTYYLKAACQIDKEEVDKFLKLITENGFLEKARVDDNNAIISGYENIVKNLKEEFRIRDEQALAERKVLLEKIESLHKTYRRTIPLAAKDQKINATFRSILVPGMGQRYLGEEPKSWWIMAAQAVSLGMAIYIRASIPGETRHFNSLRREFEGGSTTPDLYSKMAVSQYKIDRMNKDQRLWFVLAGTVYTFNILDIWI